MRNIPAIIHEPSFDTPKLPDGFKWAYETIFYAETVAFSITVVCTKNPISALLFRMRNAGLTKLTEEFKRNNYGTATRMQNTARFMHRKLYNQLFPGS